MFVNPDTGFIAAPHGIIHKTIDGGENWTAIQTPATQDVMRLCFVDENNGWATLGQYSEGHILESENSGDSWEILYPAIDGTQSIYFLNSNIGWLASWLGPPLAYGVILKTNNGGDNFITQYNCSTHTYFEDICFFSEQIGWAVGQKSSINTYYQWSHNCEAIQYGPEYDTLVLENISYADTGIYYCYATNSLATGLTLIRQPVHITIDTSVQILHNYYQKKYPLIYPNPASEKITVLLPIKSVFTNLTIYDLGGKCVFKQERIPVSNSKITAGIKGLKPGIYLLQVQAENKYYSMKLIISKRGTIK